MHPTKPASLKGKDTIVFDKYQKRKSTKEEIAWCIKSDEFYRKHLPQK